MGDAGPQAVAPDQPRGLHLMVCAGMQGRTPRPWTRDLTPQSCLRSLQPWARCLWVLGLSVLSYEIRHTNSCHLPGEL